MALDYVERYYRGVEMSIYAKNYSKFIPGATYEGAIPFVGSLSKEERPKVVSRLERDMTRLIPPEYRHKVSYPEYDLGDGTGSISWKYTL